MSKASPFSISDGRLSVQIDPATLGFNLYFRNNLLISHATIALELTTLEGESVKATLQQYLATSSTDFIQQAAEPERELSFHLQHPVLPHLLVKFRILPDRQAVGVRLTILKSGIPWKIKKLFPMILPLKQGTELRLPSGEEPDRLYRLGYQSWSPAGTVDLLTHQERPRIQTVEVMSLQWESGNRTGDNDLRANWMALLTHSQTPSGLALGFRELATKSCGVDIERSAITKTVKELRAWIYQENQVVKLDKPVVYPEFLLIPHDNAPTALDAYVSMTATSANVKVKPAAPAAWCSWYAYYRNISPSSILANARKLKESKSLAPLTYILIDDGYQREIGDWFTPAASFPKGVGSLLKDLKELGFDTGLWIAPFVASRRSQTYCRNPEWFIRDKRGLPVYAGFHAYWLRRMYALDPTNPQFMAWLSDFITQAVEDWGVSLLKLDFLYAGALEGLRTNRDVTGIEALHAGLQVIRSKAPTAYLIGCGCPLGPALGIVDGMRVGVDTAPTWEHRVSDAVLGIHATPCLKTNLHGTVVRGPLNGRWWHNDPDCLYVGSTGSYIETLQKQAMTTVAAMTAGVVMISDVMTKPTIDWRLLTITNPLSGPSAACPDLYANSFPSVLWRAAADGRGLLTLLRFDAREDIQVAFSTLGMPEQCYIFDFWNEAFLGIIEHKLDLLYLPEGSCRHMQLTPVQHTPIVVGSTFHLYSALHGMTEHVESTARGVRLRIDLMLPGRRTGKLFIVKPSGTRATDLATEGFCSVNLTELSNYVIIEGEFNNEASIQLLF